MTRCVFVDTSALYAVLDADDEWHEKAKAAWEKLLSNDEVVLITSNYVLVETSALVQRRLGADALRTLHCDVLPAMEIVWLTEDVHRAATAAVLVAGKRGVSLVDCTSFEVMRRSGISECLAFDQHFTEQGFAMSGD